MSSRQLSAEVGKRVYIRKPPPSSQAKGSATRFIRKFEGPFIVSRNVHGREDLLEVHREHTPSDTQVVNIEKLIVVPDGDPNQTEDIRDVNEAQSNQSSRSNQEIPAQSKSTHIHPDVAKVAYAIASYLKQQPNNQAYSSEACKAIYKQLPETREIVARHGRLRGIISKCPYLSLEGEATGGTYLLKLDMNIFFKTIDMH